MIALPKLFGDGALGDYIELKTTSVLASFTWWFQLPPGIWWWQWARIDSVVTDANVASRSPYIAFAVEPSTAAIRQVITDAGVQAASLTRTHVWSAGVTPSVSSSNNVTYVVHVMPQCVIVPTQHIPVVGIVAVQAGDTATGVRGGFWRVGGVK